MRIGITEAGDAAVDLSWTKKICDCDGAIIITKNLKDEVIAELLRNKKKVILHATCTGMGGTVIEPNVPDYKTQLSQVRKLIDSGFPEEQVVVRIDPIVPTEKGLATAQKVVNASPVKRFRISILDAYPHIRERFREKGIPLPYGENFQASAKQFKNANEWLRKQNPQYSFESCAEPNLECKASGCVSERDLALLGLQSDEAFKTGLQRKGCLCLSCKTELLSNKKRCPHGCLYCYWKD